MNESEVTSIVDSMRKSAIFIGSFTDTQIDNLTKYPFVVFDNIDEVSFEYDFDGSNQGTVSYKILMKGEELDEETTSQKLDHLRTMVKTLLWPDIIVNIYLDYKDGKSSS